ncbi:MAG: single-stranded-DNA-specific exonuclease RecJ [Clostridia bacterium]|nr:single-stranded-DNA-specific exonuclease RecJ [Clostridia bacterium]
MLNFTPRGVLPEDDRLLTGHPKWLAQLLWLRGIDTPEKAQKFLDPQLSQLHDPYLMQDMDKAVNLLKKAIRLNHSICVYGDYDVDGVCASSILYETLKEMGAQVRYYIPNRHGEGYGLNLDAVEAIAKDTKLLITVDCGITNIREVERAKALGLTVIVTDHHQLGEEKCPAHAVLNPLLGEYPFRRLCGAGVAFKLGMALTGLENMLPRLPLAALATVADIVPLIDENRVLVKFGLARMPADSRPGLRALLKDAGIEGPVTAGQAGFRLAPRLNAGGRLEDALQGVVLMTTQDETQAEAIAAHLGQTNTQRQALQEETTHQALELMAAQCNLAKERAIVVMGQGWNPGIIGLCASKLCEKYHYPTVVLSQGEDGLAVGSARSIPGVNIHRMLTRLSDLFIRFGGHEQAAGLTMEAEKVAEFRRRLTEEIKKSCDPECFVPTQDYDLPLNLSEVTSQMIEALSAFAPTGYGNPAPVFLLEDGHLQAARPVGREGAHLKVTLLQHTTVMDGIGFGMGDFIHAGASRVDALFTPEMNEWNGKASPQMQIKAMIPSRHGAALPPANEFLQPFLQDMAGLTANIFEIPSIQTQPLPQAFSPRQGRLFIARCPRTAKAFLADHPGKVDVIRHEITDPRSFSTLLIWPNTLRLADQWEEIYLLDGPCCPQELAALRAQCPSATLYADGPSDALKAMARTVALADEPLRALYKALRSDPRPNVFSLAKAAGLTPAQVTMGLYAFHQNHLAEFDPNPFTLRLLPPVKCRMADSPLVAALRAL